MLRKLFSTLLILLLVNLSLAPAMFANGLSEKERKFVEKLKMNIKSQGVGENSKIKLKLKDGTNPEGYISEINDTGFVVVDKSNGRNVPVSYPQIKRAKGNNWSAKEAIGIAILAGFLVVLIVAVATANDREGDSRRF